MYLPLWEMLLRLFAATAVGMVLGFEREKSKKPAGVRTHMLICLAACLIALLSAYGFSDPRMPGAVDSLRPGDPARLVVGVLSGIGFIGAGIIWKSPTGVQGITTAAEIFLLAALGIAVGLGQYVLAGVGMLIALLTMTGDALLARSRAKLSQHGAKCGAGEAGTGEADATQVVAKRRLRRGPKP